MSQVRLYVDEDAAEHAVVDGLRDQGLDVMTCHDAGAGGWTDEEQLEFASAEQRCLYTLNVGDFCRLHGEFLAGGREHSGIVVIPRQRYSVGEKLKRLTAFVDSISADDMVNQLHFL